MPSTEQYINDLLGKYDEPFSAFLAAKSLRDSTDAGKTGYNRDLNLRDAEHALFVQSQIDDGGPVLGRLQGAITVPAYSAAKVLAQNYGLGGPVKALTGRDLKNSTPPDLSELYWGLRPLWSQIKKPAGKVSGLSEFAPQ